MYNESANCVDEENNQQKHKVASLAPVDIFESIYSTLNSVEINFKLLLLLKNFPSQMKNDKIFFFLFMDCKQKN